MIAAWLLATPLPAAPAAPTPTQVRLEVDTAQGVWGRPVVMAALVRGPRDQEPPSGGWVTFLDGGRTLGTRPLVAGKALLSTARLPAGSHSLTALYAGTDAWAPSASATRRVLIEPAAPAPALEVWALPDGATSRSPVISVRGRATSSLGRPRVWVGGLEVPVDEDGTFTWAVLARDGMNRIAVVARDRAGRETRQERKVEMLYSAPHIVMDPPGDGAVLPEQEVIVTGQLLEVPCPTSEVRLAFALNGGTFSQVPLQEDAFRLPLALEPGPNVLWMRLQLPDGTQSWACRTLFRRPGPALDIQTPPDAGFTSMDTISLAGSAPDQVELILGHLPLLLDAPGGVFRAEMSLPRVGIHMATARIPGPDGQTVMVRRPILRAAYKVAAVYSMEDVKQTLDHIVGLDPGSPVETDRLDLAPLGMGNGWGDQRLEADDAAVQLLFAQGIW